MDTGASPSVYTVMSTSAVLAMSLEAQGGPAGFAWPPQHTGAEGWPLYIEDESRGSKEEPEYLEVFLQPGTRALGSNVASTRPLATAPHLLACGASRWCPKVPRPLLPNPCRAACPTVGQPPELRSSHCHHHAPGTMLLYEAARLTHGRPRRLRGKSFVNAFIHFKPVRGERGGAGARPQ